MSVQDVIDDAHSVWLYGTAPQCTEEHYSEALTAVFDELLARGQRKRLLKDPRVLRLVNAQQKLSEVQQ